MTNNMDSYIGDFLKIQGQDPAYAGMNSKQKFVDCIITNTRGLRLNGTPGSGFATGDTTNFDLGNDALIPTTGPDADAVRTVYDMEVFGDDAAHTPTNPETDPTTAKMGDTVELTTEKSGVITARMKLAGVDLVADAPVVIVPGVTSHVIVHYDAAPPAGAGHWAVVRLYYMARKAP